MKKNKLDLMITKLNLKKFTQVRYIAFGLALALALYYFKGSLVVAVVNGRPIFKTTYVKTLENMAGKQALDSLVTRSLILVEAKNKGINVSDEEIADEVTKLEEMMKQQGQELDAVLKQQNLSRKSLEEDIKMQKIVEKIVGVEEASDEEVAQYITQNQESFPEEIEEGELRASIKEQLKQQKLTSSIQSLIAELKEKAKIINWTE